MAHSTALPAIVERLIEQQKKKHPDLIKKPKEPKPPKKPKEKKSCPSSNTGFLH